MEVPQQILDYLQGKANLDRYIDKLLEAQTDAEKLCIANEIIAYEKAIGDMKLDLLSLSNEDNTTMDK